LWQYVLGVRGLRHYGLSQKHLNCGLLFEYDKLCYTALLEYRHTEIPRHQQARAATADWYVHKNVSKNDSVATKISLARLAYNDLGFLASRQKWIGYAGPGGAWEAHASGVEVQPSAHSTVLLRTLTTSWHSCR
jgi:hypothetical protein